MAYLYGYGTAGLGDDQKKAQLKAVQLERLASDAKSGVPGAAAQLATAVASGNSTIEQAIWDAKAATMRAAAAKSPIPMAAALVEQAVIAAIGPRPGAKGTKPVTTPSGTTVIVDTDTGKQVSAPESTGVSTTTIAVVGGAALLAALFLLRR